MANTKKRRVTITVDGALLDLATEVSGSDTVSGAVGGALDLFVRPEALRRGVAAHAAPPPTAQGIAVAAGAGTTPGGGAGRGPGLLTT